MPLRERAEVTRGVLRDRLDHLLPGLMAESGLDMWIVLCQEDDLDPVFRTLVPMDSWCPILQMLVFHRTPGGLERMNLSMTDTGDLYDRPWRGREPAEQWRMLGELVRERNPQRIGINTGATQWAAGGLTHNLYLQLAETLGPELAVRLESAEDLVTRWLATLTEAQIGLLEHVVSVAHALLRECYSRRAIIPGVTTARDLEWHYWQRAADLGLEPSFKPFFVLVRRERQRQRFGPEDQAIRPGDVVHSDVGIRYLGLCSDHQQPAYVLGSGETEAPAGWRELLAQGNRLQDVFLNAFRAGLTGNELLRSILSRARAAGIPNPRVYSHSLGHLLHEPGPLIGLPWEQEACAGRGDVVLHPGYAFTMELCVAGPVPEWDGQEMTLGLEEDVVFTAEGCRVLDGRLTEFHLV
jgi:Xaa-Pro aminopeptidase